MPVDTTKINAIFERLHDRDLKVQAAAVVDAATLTSPEMTALLKPYGPKFKKFKDPQGEEWYVNESSWTFGWSAGGTELFFNRPGKAWAKKRDNVRRIEWYGGGLLKSFKGLDRLQNLEEVLVRDGEFNSLAPLSACTKLKMLTICYGVEMDSLGGLKGMTSLEEIELCNPKNPPDLVETLATLTGLRTLECTVPAGADLSFLANLTKLEHLKLKTYSRTDEAPRGYEKPLGQLKNLVKVDLSWDRENNSWKRPIPSEKGGNDVDTRIAVAAKKGDWALVERLVEEGVDVNVSDKNGNTPLSCSIETKRIEYVKALIARGADVNQSIMYDSPNSTSLFTFAACNHALDICEALLDAGVDPLLPHGRCDALMEISSAPKAALLLKRLFDAGISPDYMQRPDIEGAPCLRGTSNGYSALQNTIKWKCFDNLEVFLSSGANVNIGAEYNCVPLNEAFFQNEGVVVRLLEAGADPYQLADGSGNTPLHYAANLGMIRAINWLLKKGVDVNALNSDNESALDFAREDGHEKAVERLLAAGAKDKTGAN